MDFEDVLDVTDLDIQTLSHGINLTTQIFRSREPFLSIWRERMRSETRQEGGHSRSKVSKTQCHWLQRWRKWPHSVSDP